jgi:hypothetical protein
MPRDECRRRGCTRPRSTRDRRAQMLWAVPVAPVEELAVQGAPERLPRKRDVPPDHRVVDEGGDSARRSEQPGGAQPVPEHPGRVLGDPRSEWTIVPVGRRPQVAICRASTTRLKPRWGVPRKREVPPGCYRCTTAGPGLSRRSGAETVRDLRQLASAAVSGSYSGSKVFGSPEAISMARSSSCSDWCSGAVCGPMASQSSPLERVLRVTPDQLVRLDCDARTARRP